MIDLSSISIPGSWPDDIPFDPARKRYYKVGLDFRRAIGGFKLLNQEDVFFMTEPIHGVRYPIREGAREIHIPGRPRTDRYGLPRTRAKPKLKVGTRNPPLDVYAMHDIYVSTRAKELLSRIDTDAFEFLECETLSRRRDAVEPYWMTSVVRPVEAFDEERSVFEIHKGIDGVTKVPYAGPYFSNLYDIHMLPDLDQNVHAFFFPRFLRSMIFDEVLADAWRRLRFSGWVFTPLQPPAPEERKPHLFGGDNFRYWYGAKYRTNP